MRILTLIVAVFGFMAVAAPPNTVAIRKVVIQTNAICEMCKTNIESTLNAMDGVKKAELDLVTKKVKIKYDADLLDVATLRQAIANTGYEADEVPARPKAREALAACCKKGDEVKKEGKACAKSCAKSCEGDGA